MATIDISFISSIKIIDKIKELSNLQEIILLIKPQFEAGREQVGKKGIVRDRKVHEEVIENVIRYAADNGLYPHGLTFSPVTGAKGNIEYLLYLSKNEDMSYNDAIIKATVEYSHRELE